MHSKWYASFIILAFLGFAREANAGDSNPLITTLQGAEIGADAIEAVGVDSTLLKTSGSVAGAVGTAMEVHGGISNIKRKWYSGEEYTANDFVPVIMPFMPIGPGLKAAEFAAEHIHDISNVAIKGIELLNPYASKGKYYDAEFARQMDVFNSRFRPNAFAAQSEIKQMNFQLNMEELNNINPGNYHSDTFNVDHDIPKDKENKSDKTERNQWYVSSSFFSFSGHEQKYPKQCFDFPNKIEELTKFIEERNVASIGGCVNGKVNLIDSKNSSFSYKCKGENGALIVGNIDISISHDFIKINNVKNYPKSSQYNGVQVDNYKPCN